MKFVGFSDIFCFSFCELLLVQRNGAALAALIMQDLNQSVRSVRLLLDFSDNYLQVKMWTKSENGLP